MCSGEDALLAPEAHCWPAKIAECACLHGVLPLLAYACEQLQLCPASCLQPSLHAAWQRFRWWPVWILTQFCWWPLWLFMQYTLQVYQRALQQCISLLTIAVSWKPAAKRCGALPWVVLVVVCDPFTILLEISRLECAGVVLSLSSDAVRFSLIADLCYAADVSVGHSSDLLHAWRPEQHLFPSSAYVCT